jgi:hypothetical protein
VLGGFGGRGNQQGRVTYVSDEAMKKTIAGVYRAGLDSLKERLN